MCFCWLGGLRGVKTHTLQLGVISLDCLVRCARSVETLAIASGFDFNCVSVSDSDSIVRYRGFL